MADGLSLANLAVQTAGDIFLRPRSAATTVGVAGGAGTLDLSTTVLGFMSAGTYCDRQEQRHGGDHGERLCQLEHPRGRRGGLPLRYGSDSINGAQTIGARNFTLTTNADPVIGAAVTGTGALTLETTSVGTPLGLAGGAGTVNYSAGDLTNLGSGWSGSNSAMRRMPGR